VTRGEFRFLRLVAAAPVGTRTATSTLLVAAPDWERADDERKRLTMEFVRDELLRYSGCNAAAVRTFLWDGERETPFPDDQPSASTDQAG
jgi:hypothetical protein